MAAGATLALAADDPANALEPATPAAKKPGRDPLKFQLTLLDNKKASIRYSRKGLQFKSADGRYSSRIRWRTQIRYSFPFDQDPRKDGDFGAVPADKLFFRRARLKIDGNLFGPFVKYTYEHDLLDGYLLNLYADIKIKEWFQIRGGQWKADFSRERRTSSGKQQFVERSMVNREFTLDRQAGFGIVGHLMPGTRGDSRYFAEIFTGTGRGNGWDSDGHPMIVARYQWNFIRRDLGWSSSDIEHHESPAASLAIAGVSNRGRFTRFSSSGGSQLDGYEPGAPGQYSLKQVMGEFFLKYRGLSIQNENHWKNIYDNVNLTSQNHVGSYAQVGYFIGYLWPDIPKNVELGYRYTFVDSNTAIPSDVRQEHTIVVNVFFEGHENKLSFDVGRISLDQPGTPDLTLMRYRLQWDVQF